MSISSTTRPTTAYPQTSDPRLLELKEFITEKVSRLPENNLVKRIANVIDFNRCTQTQTRLCEKIIKCYTLAPGAEEMLKEQKRIRELFEIYHKYNEEYENYEAVFTFFSKKDQINALNSGNPQLLDALGSGMTKYSIKHSCDEYSESTEQDIKDIVRLTPQSINCPLGYLRGAIITPITMACLNHAVPVHIVEFLLKNGADANTTVEFESKKMYLLRFLSEKASIKAERYLKLEQIFLANGLDPDWASKRLTNDEEDELDGIYI